MEWEEMAMGEPNPAMMQVAAEETVRTSTSLTALGGQAPTGVGPRLRASVPAEGQHWPPTLRVATSRRSLRQRRHRQRAKGGVARDASSSFTRAKGGAATDATKSFASKGRKQH